MTNLDIGNATLSDMTNRVKDYKVAAEVLDAATGQKETEYMNAFWSIYWGYFNSHPDLKSAILMKAVWIVGKGWNADPFTTVILDHISGWGKDTLDDIIFNMLVQKMINGDAYSEKIGDKDHVENSLHMFKGTLINLKPLDPGSIKIVVDEKGIIKRYEQVNRIEGKQTQIKFHPNKIFHLCHNRIGNQIHGISDIKSLEPVLKSEEESFIDIKQVSHRNARPLIMFKIKTDIPSKIDEFVNKMDEALNKGENIYIPDDENTISYEVVQVNVGSIVMDWRNDIRNKFYRTIGLPQIVPGAGGQSTESESKVIYFAFEQIVKRDQLLIEKQIWNQLQLKIKLTPPTSLMQDLQVDSQKDLGGDDTLGVQLNAANKEEI